MPNYVNNAELLKLLREYKEYGDKKVETKICKQFFKIIENLLLKPCFVNYTNDRKDEMNSNAIFFMYKYLDNFDCYSYSNPFAYFTTICYNAFLQTIKKYFKRSEMFIPLDFIENISNSDNVDLTKQVREIYHNSSDE